MSGFSFSSFGIDPHTGFLSPEPPLRRLPGVQERWEVLLDDAMANFVYTGSAPEITFSQRVYGCVWRKRVRTVSIVFRIDNVPHGLTTLTLFSDAYHQLL